MEKPKNKNTISSLADLGQAEIVLDLIGGLSDEVFWLATPGLTRVLYASSTAASLFGASPNTL